MELDHATQVSDLEQSWQSCLLEAALFYNISHRSVVA